MSRSKPTGTRYRIAADTGGTFTDVVISGDDGTLGVGKALTTPKRVYEGFRGSLERAASTIGLSSEHVLGNADVIVYGTTHATNAVLTGNTARTALLITDGFADTLALREGGRRNVFDTHAPYPAPYIPRHLTFELRERISAEGDIVTPLDESHARQVISSLSELGVEAVAVMLLWSVIEDAHEQRVGELLEELLPSVPYTLSSRANAAVREYRRASAAAIDASLKPLMRAHFHDLRADLTDAGFDNDLLVVTSEGAVQDVGQVADRPVLTINSGPSMAPVVGASFAPEADAVVVCDMGGTTFDVSLVERGSVRHTREGWLGEPFVGHLTGLSSVAVKSIGAGGGSIAWVDAGGLLRVGPQSAGSEPGPAAYGLGGEEPTVTDAAVALGYLNEGGFGAGFVLDRQAAENAITARIGTPLGLGVEAAAEAILEVSSNHMASAIRQATVEEGLDPRGATLVAGGGAGPMVATRLAELLECERLVVPRTAGVLAAYGAHEAAIATEFTVPRFVSSLDFDSLAVERALDDLEAESDTFFERFQTLAQVPRRSFFVDARYPAQAWELRIALGDRPVTDSRGVKELADAFHREHLQRNGTAHEGSDVEFVAWGVRAELEHPKTQDLRLAAAEHAGGPYRTDKMVFDSRTETAGRFAGAELSQATDIPGPAVIDEDITTVVVRPGWRVLVDADRNYHFERSTKSP